MTCRSHLGASGRHSPVGRCDVGRAAGTASTASTSAVPLGHASIKTTLDTYGHLFEGLDEAAADRLEATFASADVHPLMCTRCARENILK
jgi:hypothetical protein